MVTLNMILNFQITVFQKDELPACSSHVHDRFCLQAGPFQDQTDMRLASATLVRHGLFLGGRLKVSNLNDY